MGFDLVAGGQCRRRGRVHRQDDAGGQRPVGLSGQLQGGQSGLGDGVILEDLNVLAAHRGVGHGNHANAHGR